MFEIRNNCNKVLFTIFDKDKAVKLYGKFWDFDSAKGVYFKIKTL